MIIGRLIMFHTEYTEDMSIHNPFKVLHSLGPDVLFVIEKKMG